MHKFLRNYRATPHVTTNRTPAELLFGRNLKIALPEIPERLEDAELRARDQNQKAIQKENADRKLYEADRSFASG